MICPVWLCFDWSMGCIPLIHLNAFPKDPRLFIVLGFWIILVLIFYKLLFSKNYDIKYVFFFQNVYYNIIIINLYL